MSKIEISTDGVTFEELKYVKLGNMGRIDMPILSGDDDPDMIRTMFTSAFMLGFKASREGFNAECQDERMAPDHLSSTMKIPCESMADFAKLMGGNEAFHRLLNEAMASAGLTPF